jgi:hypothetical protein
MPSASNGMVGLAEVEGKWAAREGSRVGPSEQKPTQAYSSLLFSFSFVFPFLFSFLLFSNLGFQFEFMYL